MKTIYSFCVVILVSVILSFFNACAKDPLETAEQVLTRAEEQFQVVFNREIRVDRESDSFFDISKGEIVNYCTYNDDCFCVVTDSVFASTEELKSYLLQFYSQALCNDLILPALFGYSIEKDITPLYWEQSNALYVNCDRGYLGNTHSSWDWETASILSHDNQSMIVRIRKVSQYDEDEWFDLKYIYEDETWKLNSFPFEDLSERIAGFDVV